MDTVEIDGITLTLSKPDILKADWVGEEDLIRQMLAAWLTIDDNDLPLNPRLTGKPGTGKTTLAYYTAKEILKRDVYIFQCTVDTRPEDLIITPVIGDNNTIRYHASSLLSAMLKGGVAILDEGNRMDEKSWASLAPLLDDRKYVESIIAGIKVKAHKDFRIAVTMNEDASTFEIPEYIHSRLQPTIEIGYPQASEEMDILKINLPFSTDEILDLTVGLLQKGHRHARTYSVRDGINIARYALKIMKDGYIEKTSEAFEFALKRVLGDEGLKFYKSNEINFSDIDDDDNPLPGFFFGEGFNK